MKKPKFIPETKTVSDNQIALAVTLAERHNLRIPTSEFYEYSFTKNFIDLFAYDPDRSGDMTGLRRVSVIESYLYYDKEYQHLQFKLDLTSEEVHFMAHILAVYKYDGSLPRENQNDRDPEETYYRNLELQELEVSFNC